MRFGAEQYLNFRAVVFEGECIDLRKRNPDKAEWFLRVNGIICRVLVKSYCLVVKDAISRRCVSGGEYKNVKQNENARVGSEDDYCNEEQG